MITLCMTMSGALACLAGLLHGGREAFHADAKVFEAQFGVLPLSFFGSQSWLRKYRGREVSGGIRAFVTPFSDFWHLAAWLGKAALVWAAVLGMLSGVHFLIVAAAVYGIQSFAASVSYKWLRYKKII